jgi:hypothetical protein
MQYTATLNLALDLVLPFTAHAHLVQDNTVIIPPEVAFSPVNAFISKDFLLSWLTPHSQPCH